jgi:excisionase family DNA binding protein
MDSGFIPQNMFRLLTPTELAGLLGISKPTIYRLVEKRTLPSYKIGGSLRFKESDVVAYLETCRITPTNELYEHTQTRK